MSAPRKPSALAITQHVHSRRTRAQDGLGHQIVHVGSGPLSPGSGGSPSGPPIGRKRRILKRFAGLVMGGCAALFLTVVAIFVTGRYFRSCAVPWETVQGPASSSPKIAIVTMSTGKPTGVMNPAWSAAERADFTRKADSAHVMALTEANKKRYSERHGYTYFDGSKLIDPDRPPSWSKIKAVLAAFDEGAEWAFWMDADTLVTNVSTAIPSAFLPSDPSIDLLLTFDAGGVNAGVWILRNSDWARAFLETWWSMDWFIRPKGDSKSGDNDALKAIMAAADVRFMSHVGIAPQCAFNSYKWRPSLRNAFRLLAMPRVIMAGLWARGDFLLHLAGSSRKGDVLREFVKQQLRYARRHAAHGGRRGGDSGSATSDSASGADVDPGFLEMEDLAPGLSKFGSEQAEGVEGGGGSGSATGTGSNGASSASSSSDSASSGRAFRDDGADGSGSGSDSRQGQAGSGSLVSAGGQGAGSQTR